MSGYHMPCVDRQTAFHTEVFFILQLDENNKTVRHFDSEPALFGPHLPKDGFAVSGSGLVLLCYLNLMSPISNSATGSPYAALHIANCILPPPVPVPSLNKGL